MKRYFICEGGGLEPPFWLPAALEPSGLQTRYKCASCVQNLIHWLGFRSLTRFIIYHCCQDRNRTCMITYEWS